MLFHELSEVAHRANEDMHLMGTAVNSFFVFLLGYQHPNPLPAHYYCEECGYFELGELTFADDLPEKECPKCGHPLMRDGYTLHEEFAWGKRNKLNFEYRIASAFSEAAYETVRKHYAEQDREITTAWMGTRDNERLGIKANPHPDGVIVLDKGKTTDDYSFPETPDIGQAHDNKLDYVLMIESETMDELHDYLVESLSPLENVSAMLPQSIPFDELVKRKVIPQKDAEIFAGIEAPNLRKLVNHYSAYHSTLETTEKEVISRGINFAILEEDGLYCREDIFEEMLQAGASREDAFLIAEAISKGQFRKEIVPKRELPDRVKAMASMVVYLFPRGHIVEYWSHISRLVNLMAEDK